MKMFWINLTKQKFMNWAAGFIVFFYAINVIGLQIFISSNVKVLTAPVYERILGDINAQTSQIVMMVLLYFFGNKSGSNEPNEGK